MPIPDHLYKYESFSIQAPENLKNHSLYFGSPTGFNDPYDCAIFPSVKDLSPKDIQRIRSHHLAKTDLSSDVRRQFENINDAGLRLILLQQGQAVLDAAVNEFFVARGVTCFSERNNSLLMWAHYGGRFKGFCLEFRTDFEPFHTARKVIYTNEMPQVDVLPLLCETPESDEILNLYCTKALDWQYEKEWRCMHNRAGTVYKYPAEALTGIYIGPDTTHASLEIVALIITNQNPDVKIWQGKRSKSDFSVVFEHITYTPHIEAKRLGLLPAEPIRA
jgi:hypothetical protein